jgi:hypothetical protein
MEGENGDAGLIKRALAEAAATDNGREAQMSATMTHMQVAEWLVGKFLKATDEREQKRLRLYLRVMAREITWGELHATLKDF